MLARLLLGVCCWSVWAYSDKSAISLILILLIKTLICSIYWIGETHLQDGFPTQTHLLQAPTRWYLGPSPNLNRWYVPPFHNRSTPTTRRDTSPHEGVAG